MSTPGRHNDLRVVLFDLDGTLADTFKDLLWALNRALAEHGHAQAPEARIRDRVSQGARAMTRAALDDDGFAIEPVEQRFLEIYAQNIAVRTTLFDGMAEVLDALDTAGIRYGIVTNKRAMFTELLIDQLQLRSRLCCLVSGDTAARAKPHPDPLLLAAQRCGVVSEQCVYVGDAQNDVRSARAAGMAVGVATWGYLGADDDPTQWAADALLDDPQALRAWLLDAPPTARDNDHDNAGD